MVKNLASLARGRDVTGGFVADSRKVDYGVCIGGYSNSNSAYNTVIGAGAEAENADDPNIYIDDGVRYGRSVAVGTSSYCKGVEAVAVGFRSNVRSSGQTVIGWSSGGTDSDDQVVIGKWSTGADNAPNQIVLGSHLAGEPNVVGTYISPIREDNTLTGNNYVVTYNTDTKELKHTAINLDTSGAPQQGLQSVTDIGNTTTNNIEVSNSADPNDKIEYGHNIIKIHGNDNSVLIGDTETANGNTRRIAIGHDAGRVGQASSTVAIGPEAGVKDQGYAAIAIGDTAGGRDGMGERSIAIGFETGTTNGVQPLKSICIGSHAQTQENAIYSIAIGDGVDVGTGAYDSIALGKTVTLDSTASRSIGIGDNSEVNASLGISIGRNNTISVGHDLCIAIGTGITTQHPSSFYVSPIRTETIYSNILDADILGHDANNEIIKLGNIEQLIGNTQIYNDIINNIDTAFFTLTSEINQHIQKQEDGLSLNGYHIITVSTDTTLNNTDHVYGRVLRVTQDNVNITLPPASEGMNFILTFNASMALSSATCNIIAHTNEGILYYNGNTNALSNNITIDSGDKLIVRFICNENEVWVMQ